MWQSPGEHKKVTKLYELKKTLGRGHFAVVKLAHHLLTGEKVAIKVIDKTKLDKVSADHLYHEVTCMKLVQHPNVVRLYQVIETETKLYLILELGDGGDMFDYIMRHDKGLPESHAKEYFSQILSAIVYCHKLHVVHRDLKPENVVFFESQGLVKLTDFGFSNCYRPGEKLSTSCGSLAYSAPEILLGEEYDAPAVDVWSLGVILYMLVCGVAPFNEANDSETLTNIMDCRYTILDHVGDDCKDLISRMIIRDPTKRMTLEEITQHEWLRDCDALQQQAQSSFHKEPISDEIHHKVVGTMLEASMASASEINEALQDDLYDHVTSTYYLLAERLRQQQLQPVAPPPPEDAVPKKKKAGQLEARKPHSPCPSYSVSPPPPPSAQLELSRSRSNSCGVEGDNASGRTPYHHHHHHHQQHTMSREHLTITPRRGFSVARGGIDTLIEEEERSRSQTTTDDETEDDELNHFNPNLLASRLQRASLQIKRIKKRKSAPMVLNEICEENEMEYHHHHHTNHHTHHHHHHHAISPATSTSNPNVVLASRLLPQLTKSALTSAAATPRTGRVRARHATCSNKTDEGGEPLSLLVAGGNDGCGDEVESATSGSSSRASSANLSSVVANKLIKFRHRRDSSDGDHDDEGGGGGGRKTDFSSTFTPLNELHSTDTTTTNNTSDQQQQQQQQQTTTTNNNMKLNNNNKGSATSRDSNNNSKRILLNSSSSSSRRFNSSSFHLHHSNSLRLTTSVTSLRSDHVVTTLRGGGGRHGRRYNSLQTPRKHLHHHHHHHQKRHNNAAHKQTNSSSKHRSNLSLASSTCSKFQVDPLNEFLPPDAPHTPTATAKECSNFAVRDDSKHHHHRHHHHQHEDKLVLIKTNKTHHHHHLSTILARLGRFKQARQQQQNHHQVSSSRRRKRNNAVGVVSNAAAATTTTGVEEGGRRMKHHECCSLM